MLSNDGKAQQLWQYEDSAAWVSGDPNAGFIVREPQAAGGLSTFTWVRNDGTGLQFFAQPYHTVQGVAGDAYGGLWWIETPQATMDQWQLWHYDPATATIALRLQATGALFTADDEGTRRTPILQAVQPVIPGDVSNVTLFVDTVGHRTPDAFCRLLPACRADRWRRGGAGDAMAHSSCWRKVNIGGRWLSAPISAAWPTLPTMPPFRA